MRNPSMASGSTWAAASKSENIGQPAKACMHAAAVNKAPVTAASQACQRCIEFSMHSPC